MIGNQKSGDRRSIEERLEANTKLSSTNHMSFLCRKRNGDKEFVVVDASMTDLIRPALYSAEHLVLPVRESDQPDIRQSVVGPVCESGDFLGEMSTARFVLLFSTHGLQPRMLPCLHAMLAIC